MDQSELKNTMMEWLGIELTTATPTRIEARMPVDHRTHQPAGLLHGGASVALAETVASLGTYLNIDRQTQTAVGLEINANHIRSVREGYVYATATPLHSGKSTFVWDIRIVDEAQRLVCVSRCTVAVVPFNPDKHKGANSEGKD